MSADAATLSVKHKETEDVLVKVIAKFTRLADVSNPSHKVHKADKSAGLVIRTGESGDGVPVPYFMCTGPIHELGANAVVDDLMVGNMRRHEWCPSWDECTPVDSWDAETDELRALLGERRRVEVYLERTKPMVGGIISARCFVFAKASWEADGRYWVALASVDSLLQGELPAAYAKLPHGTMFVSGTVAKDNADGHGCEATSLVQTIAGGSIPNWAVTKGVSSELTSFFTLVNKVFAATPDKK